MPMGRMAQAAAHLPFKMDPSSPGQGRAHRADGTVCLKHRPPICEDGSRRSSYCAARFAWTRRRARSRICR
jgi:hypothetical protein